MLETEDYRLRAAEKKDVLTFYIWENLSDDWQSSMTATGPCSLTQIENYFLTTDNDPFKERQLLMILADKDSDSPVGFVELTSVNPLTLTAEVGFFISPEHRGKGIGAEMLRLVVEYCRDHLGLHSLSASTSVENKSAQGILTRNGFVPAGKLRGWLRKKGGNRVDLLLYQIIFE